MGRLMRVLGDVWAEMGLGIWWFTLWWCQNSYWSHGPVEIVDLPSYKKMVNFHSFLYVYQRVNGISYDIIIDFRWESTDDFNIFQWYILILDGNQLLNMILKPSNMETWAVQNSWFGGLIGLFVVFHPTSIVFWLEVSLPTRRMVGLEARHLKFRQIFSPEDSTPKQHPFQTLHFRWYLGMG